MKKQYTFDNDYAVGWFMQDLDEHGIPFTTKVEGATITIEMEDTDALRTGIERPPAPKTSGLTWLAWAAIIAVLLFVFCSCGVPRKHLAQACAEQYPSETDTITREHIKIVPVPYPEYEFIYLDTTICPPALPEPTPIIKQKTAKAPARTQQVAVPCIDTILNIRDHAREALLQQQLDACRKELEQQRSRAQRRSGYVYAFYSVVVAAFLAGLIAFVKKGRG